MYDKGTSEIYLICIQRSDSEQVVIISSNTKESRGKESTERDRKITAAQEIHTSLSLSAVRLSAKYRVCVGSCIQFGRKRLADF